MSSTTVSAVVFAGPVAVTVTSDSATPVLTVGVISPVNLPVVGSIICFVVSTI